MENYTMKKVWDKDRFEKRNRCGDCGKPCIAFYCPECTQRKVTQEMKGRLTPTNDQQRFGTDQDMGLKVRRDRTSTGQECIVISYQNVEMPMTIRTAIDLQHKLGKLIIDSFTDMMLIFMKEK